MLQLARHLLLWSRKHLKSLCIIHIPGFLNRTADELSRAALPGDWRLHPQTVQLIWRHFGLAQLDLFVSLETSHCQWFYSLNEGTLGTDALAHSWPQGLRKYAFPPSEPSRTDTVQDQGKEEQILLVAPYWPTRTWFPELMLLVTAPPWQIPWGRIYWLRDGTPCGTRVHTSGNFMSGPWTGRGGSRWPTPKRESTPSLRREHCLRDTLTPWSWTCSLNGALLTEDPGKCPISVVVSFLQQRLKRRLSPPSLTPMWLRLLPTTTPQMGSWWGSMTGSSGSLGEREVWILHGPPLYPLGTCL